VGREILPKRNKVRPMFFVLLGFVDKKKLFYSLVPDITSGLPNIICLLN
jgi:hypothetical protein